MTASWEVVRRVLRIFILAMAIEALFMVPYGLMGAFRPLLSQTFSLSNRDLGMMSSAYGIVSMCLYLPGGYVADRFRPKLLMVAALFTTAACCCYLSIRHSLVELILIWSILAAVDTVLFWSAFVSAIRHIGGEEHSGKAFGFEQLSRGASSSLLTLVLAAQIRMVLSVQTAKAEARAEAMSMLLGHLAILEVAMAFLIMVALPPRMAVHADASPSEGSRGQVCHEAAKGVSTICEIIKRPAVWLHALVVVTAYCGNIATSYFSGLATFGYAMDEVRAAEISTLVTWMRAWAGLLAGMAADRGGRTRICCGLFLAYGCAYLWVALAPVDPEHPGMLMAQIAASAASVYAIAGVYFTLLDEAKLPLELTGSAVGIISTVGFTPDIFMGQIAACWFDAYPRALGYQYFYACMAGIGFAGFLVTLAFAHVVGRPGDTESLAQQALGSDPTAACSGSSPPASTGEASAPATESTTILATVPAENPSQRSNKALYGCAASLD